MGWGCKAEISVDVPLQACAVGVAVERLFALARPKNGSLREQEAVDIKALDSHHILFSALRLAAVPVS